MLQICQKYALICANLQRNSSFYEEIGVFYDDFAFCVRYGAFFFVFPLKLKIMMTTLNHIQRRNSMQME